MDTDPAETVLYLLPSDSNRLQQTTLILHKTEAGMENGFLRSST